VQRRRDRRDPGYAAAPGIALVDADDAHRALFSVLVGDGDRGAEIHLRVRSAGVVDDLRGVDPLIEKADAAVDLAQPALAVNVVAVLRAVAVARRPGDDVDQLRPLDLPQVRQLVVQAL